MVIWKLIVHLVSQKTVSIIFVNSLPVLRDFNLPRTLRIVGVATTYSRDYDFRSTPRQAAAPSPLLTGPPTRLTPFSVLPQRDYRTSLPGPCWNTLRPSWFTCSSCHRNKRMSRSNRRCSYSSMSALLRIKRHYGSERCQLGRCFMMRQQIWRSQITWSARWSIRLMKWTHWYGYKSVLVVIEL